MRFVVLPLVGWDAIQDVEIDRYEWRFLLWEMPYIVDRDNEPDSGINLAAGIRLQADIVNNLGRSIARQSAK